MSMLNVLLHVLTFFFLESNVTDMQEDTICTIAIVSRGLDVFFFFLFSQLEREQTRYEDQMRIVVKKGKDKVKKLLTKEVLGPI